MDTVEITTKPSGFSTQPATLQEAEKIFDNVITDFKNCLEDYKSITNTWFLGRFVDMDQQITVGDMKVEQNKQSSSAMHVVAKCPLSGEITIVHSFRTAGKTIPIAHTKYAVYEVSDVIKPNNSYIGSMYVSHINYNLKKVTEGNVDENGKATLKLEPNKKYKVVFYPDVTDADLKKLYASYDDLIAQCSDWLQKSWENGQHDEWVKYLSQGANINYTEGLKAFADGIMGTLKDIWDLLCDIFNFMCDPAKHISELSKLIPNPSELIEKYDSAKEEISEMLMMLKDEAMLFILFYAAFSYFKLFTGQQILNLSATVFGAVLTELIIGIILPGSIVKKGFDIAMNFA